MSVLVRWKGQWKIQRESSETKTIHVHHFFWTTSFVRQVQNRFPLENAPLVEVAPPLREHFPKGNDFELVELVDHT